MFSEVRKRAKKAGQPPGTPIYTGSAKNATSITVIIYNNENYKEVVGDKLDEILPKKQQPGITWVNVEGLRDVALINELSAQFNLHPLTVEDILNVEQRPKVEEFDNYIFITLKVLLRYKGKRIATKQLSLVLGKDFILSFQELDTTLFDNIRTRLDHGGPHQRLRENGSDYLAYRLIDAVVDEYFLVLEVLGDQIEKIEEHIIAYPTPQSARDVYRLKRQILQLRRAVWPMREALSHLMHVEESFITNFTRVYLRDVYDHTMQAIDTIETFRDMLSSMLDMYLSSMTNRMNEVMKTLTIISTIFIPITAIASIYGMNFPNMLGIHWVWGYPTVIGLMVIIALLMLFYFHKKEWI